MIGVPDESTARSCARGSFATTAPPSNEQEIKDYCQGKIAHYKIPRYVMFVDGWPMTVSGKVQKYKMREESIRLLGLEAAAEIVTA